MELLPHFRCRLVFGGMAYAIDAQAARRRRCSRSKPAPPYIWRLSIRLDQFGWIAQLRSSRRSALASPMSFRIRAVIAGLAAARGKKCPVLGSQIGVEPCCHAGGRRERLAQGLCGGCEARPDLRVREARPARRAGLPVRVARSEMSMRRMKALTLDRSLIVVRMAWRALHPFGSNLHSLLSCFDL